MPDLEDFAMRMLQSNPQIANNPNAQQMVNAICNHDSAAGQQIASNLCNTYGIDRNQAVQEAKRFFGIP